MGKTQESEVLSTPQETPDEGQELRMGEFNEDPEALLKLGILMTGLLEKFGIVTLMVDGEGAVSYVNPAHVFLSSTLVSPPKGKVPKRTRPIISTGRPQYVDIDENGTVWEVEFVDEDGADS